MPQRIPNGIAVVRAVILVTVMGTVVWYLVWKLAAHFWARH
jgi:hypothetical protein